MLAAKKNLRLLIAGALPDPRAPTLTVRSVAGGLLVQDRDNGILDPAALKVITRRAPTATELADLEFAGASASTSNPTRSSTPRTAPPLASARGRCRASIPHASRGKRRRTRRERGRPRPSARSSRPTRFSLRRRARRGDRGRRDRHDPTRRLAARRRSDRGGRRGRDRDGLHGDAAFPALKSELLSAAAGRYWRQSHKGASYEL